MKKLTSNISKFFADVKDKRTETGLYLIAKEGLAVGKTYTPINTSVLINSEFGPIIQRTESGAKATVGFGAEYAVFVHNESGKLKGVPRKNGNGYYWSPDAEPRFLERGFDEIKTVIPDLLKVAYETK